MHIYHNSMRISVSQIPYNPRRYFCIENLFVFLYKVHSWLYFPSKACLPVSRFWFGPFWVHYRRYFQVLIYKFGLSDAHLSVLSMYIFLHRILSAVIYLKRYVVLYQSEPMTLIPVFIQDLQGSQLRNLYLLLVNFLTCYDLRIPVSKLEFP